MPGTHRPAAGDGCTGGQRAPSGGHFADSKKQLGLCCQSEVNIETSIRFGYIQV